MSTPEEWAEARQLFLDMHADDELKAAMLASPQPDPFIEKLQAVIDEHWQPEDTDERAAALALALEHTRDEAAKAQPAAG